MKIFSQLIVAFCASSVFIGVLYLLCPDGVMSKSVKYILGLAFLLSVIAAAGITVKTDGFEFKEYEFPVSDMQNIEIATAKQVYAYALTKSGINFKEITVCTNKADDGSIIINKIIIYSDAEREKIIESLGEAAQNFEVEIIDE